MKRKRRSAIVLIVILCAMVGLGFGWYFTHQKTASTRNTQLSQESVHRKSHARGASVDNQKRATKIQSGKLITQKGISRFSRLTGYLKENHFVGAALIIKNGRLFYREAFGYANFADQLKNRPNSEFQILSIQKSLTAAGVMKLVQEKKLSLFTPLARFYPTIPNAKQIKIRNLLDMDSGLSLRNTGPKQVLNERQVIAYDRRHLVSRRANFGKWQYQPVNYVLLAGIISKLTGKSYQQYFNQLFTKPMKLKGTGFVQNQRPSRYQTVGYRYLKASQMKPNYSKPFNETKASMNDELGTGQVYMTAFELFKVESRLLRGKIVSLANVKTLHTAGTSSTYGGGIYNQSNGIRSHGIGYGYESVILISRNGENAVVLLSNHYRPAASIQNLAVPMFNRLMAGKLN